MERIRLAMEDGIARIALDDGKANAMSEPWFAELAAALDAAEQAGATALLIHGNERFLSGGLDLKLLPTLGPASMRALVRAFARTMMRVFLFPRPTAAALTGHAVAGGCVLALACDLRIACDGDFRLQMNEVAIGIPLPTWMLAIARESVPLRWQTELLLHARPYAPQEALERGLVDEVAESAGAATEQARKRLAALAGTLQPAAYAESKRRLRAARVEAALQSLDRETLGPPA